jgi:hypothetical protein
MHEKSGQELGIRQSASSSYLKISILNALLIPQYDSVLAHFIQSGSDNLNARLDWFINCKDIPINCCQNYFSRIKSSRMWRSVFRLFMEPFLSGLVKKQASKHFLHRKLSF